MALPRSTSASLFLRQIKTLHSAEVESFQQVMPDEGRNEPHHKLRHESRNDPRNLPLGAVAPTDAFEPSEPLETFANNPLASTEAMLAENLQSLALATGKYFVTYFPILAKLCANPKAALMLGHAIYLTRSIAMAGDTANREGWFWKSEKDWHKATGLSLREQATSRACLCELGFVSERRAGMPARLYFRVNLDALGQRLAQSINTQYTEWTWEERAVRTLLGRPLAFYAPFAWLLGSATSGIYLSQLVNDVRVSAKSGQVPPHGYLNGRSSDSWAEYGLGEKAARHAKTDLQAIGILDCKRASIIKGKLLVRLDLAKLASAVVVATQEIHNAGNSQSTMLETHNQQCEKPALCFGQKRITGSAKNAEQLQPKTQNSFGQKRISSSAEMAEPLIKGFKLTKQLLQEPLQFEAKAQEISVGVAVVDELKANEEGGIPPSTPPNFEDLVFPPFFLPKEVEAARQLLNKARCDNAQELLDEITGKSDAKPGSVRSGLGLLQTLVTAVKAGGFFPAYAAKVQNKRDQASIALRQQIVDRQAADVAKLNEPSAEATRAIALERLRQLKLIATGRRSTC
jgi:hypothetical protein